MTASGAQIVALFFILFICSVASGPSIIRQQAEDEDQALKRGSSENEASLDNHFSNAQSHKLPMELLEPDLARQIFAGVSNPLKRTTISRLQRVTTKPNVRLRRSTDMIHSNSRNFDKRAIEAKWKSGLESAESDDYMSMNSNLTALENIDSDSNITVQVITTNKFISSEDERSTMPTTITHLNESTKTSLITATESSTTGSSPADIMIPTNIGQPTPNPHDGITLEKSEDSITEIQSFDLIENSTLPERSNGTEDSPENALELSTLEPLSTSVTPIRNQLSSGESETPLSNATTDFERLAITTDPLQHQPLSAVMVPMNSIHQPISEKQKELSQKIDEKVKLQLVMRPEEYILVVGDEMRTMDPDGTPLDSGIVTFRDQNGFHRVKIEAEPFVNGQFFGPDPLKRSRILNSGSTIRKSPSFTENGIKKAKRDLQEIRSAIFEMSIATSTRLRREAAENKDDQIEIIDGSSGGSFASSKDTKTSLSSTSEATDTASTNGNEKETHELVERDDAKLAIIPRLVSVTKDPETETEITLIKESELSEDAERKHFQREATQIMPQTEHKKHHHRQNSRTFREVSVFDGGDVLGELSNLVDFRPPEETENRLPPPPSMSLMRQPNVLQNQPLANANFGPTIFAQQSSPVPQNFIPRARPLPQSFIPQTTNFISQGFVPQFTQRQQQQQQFLHQPPMFLLETPGTASNPQPQLFLLRPILSPVPMLRPVLPRPQMIRSHPPPFPETQVISAQVQPQITSPPSRFQTRFEVFSDLTQPPQTTTTTTPFLTTEPIGARIYSNLDPAVSVPTDFDSTSNLRNKLPQHKEVTETLDGENVDVDPMLLSEDGAIFVDEDADLPSMKSRSINSRLFHHIGSSNRTTLISGQKENGFGNPAVMVDGISASDEDRRSETNETERGTKKVRYVTRIVKIGRSTSALKALWPTTTAEIPTETTVELSTAQTALATTRNTKAAAEGSGTRKTVDHKKSSRTKESSAVTSAGITEGSDYSLYDSVDARENLDRTPGELVRDITSHQN